MRGLLYSSLLVLVLALGCGSGEPPGPDPDSADPGPDAGAAQVCGPAPGSCDFFGPECPGLEDVCSGVCGAAAECCTCDTDAERWTVTFYDCPPCEDSSGAL